MYVHCAFLFKNFPGSHSLTSLSWKPEKHIKTPNLKFETGAISLPAKELNP